MVKEKDPKELPECIPPSSIFKNDEEKITEKDIFYEETMKEKIISNIIQPIDNEIQLKTDIEPKNLYNPFSILNDHQQRENDEIKNLLKRIEFLEEKQLNNEKEINNLHKTNISLKLKLRRIIKKKHAEKKLSLKKQ